MAVSLWISYFVFPYWMPANGEVCCASAGCSNRAVVLDIEFQYSYAAAAYPFSDHAIYVLHTPLPVIKNTDGGGGRHIIEAMLSVFPLAVAIRLILLGRSVSRGRSCRA